MPDIGMDSDVDIGTLPISDDSFQSDRCVTDIRITDVDVRCRISPTTLQQNSIKKIKAKIFLKWL
jgi:hypothetical protein